MLKNFILLGLFSSIFCKLIFAHGGEDHHKKDEAPAQASLEKNEIHKKNIHEINQHYMKTVKPIFKNKCFNCHSNETQYPWYYALPGAKGVIDKDIAEARKHLDMSEDFPFRGHGTPASDLKAIIEAVNKRTMPPLKYKLLHWKSYLNEVEEQDILGWAEKGHALLTNKEN